LSRLRREVESELAAGVPVSPKAAPRNVIGSSVNCLVGITPPETGQGGEAPRAPSWEFPVIAPPVSVAVDATGPALVNGTGRATAVTHRSAYVRALLGRIHHAATAFRTALFRRLTTLRKMPSVSSSSGATG
jgi:hypothetical protein